jgi:hypothetical protein
MTSKQLAGAFVLLLCGVVILYFFARSLSSVNPGPIWYLLAVPAILVARIAWRRMRRP